MSIKKIILTLVAVGGLWVLLQTKTVPSAALVSQADAQSAAAILEIKLPPSSIFTPKKLVIGNQNYNFNGGTFVPANQGKLTISTATYSVAGYPAYDIAVSGFARGNKIAQVAPLNKAVAKLVGKASAQIPPASSIFWLLGGAGVDYRLTFNNPPVAAATAIATNLVQNPTKISDDLYLNAQSDCAAADHTTGTYLCVRSTVSFVTPELPATTKYLLQSINALAPGIIVNGNVAAPKTIAGFTFGDPKSVAVGGAVNVSGGQNLQNYQTVSSKLAWAQVSPKLQTIFSERTKGTQLFATAFNGSTWYLNAPGTDPTNGNSSSYSSQPEGKLWNIDNGAAGGLTIAVPAGGLTFNGRGTIAVSGNVTFTGSGAINCTNGDFGVIASGSITFQNGVGPINCGAFVALGGNINLQQRLTASQSWSSIFVAANNVVLPTIASGNLIINYDATFAEDPTVLFTDVLNIVFVSSS